MCFINYISKVVSSRTAVPDTQICAQADNLAKENGVNPLIFPKENLRKRF